MKPTCDRECIGCGVSLGQYSYHPDPENLPYCFSCFLQFEENNHRFRSDIQYILLLELKLQDNYIIVGCRNTADSEQIAQNIKEVPFGRWIKSEKIQYLDSVFQDDSPIDFTGQPLFTDHYCWHLAMWESCTNSLFDTDCYIDTNRAVSEDAQGKIRSWSFKYFKDKGGFHRIEILGDIEDIAYDILPITTDIFDDIPN